MICDEYQLHFGFGVLEADASSGCHLSSDNVLKRARRAHIPNGVLLHS